jgi:hypothetical protein
VTEKSALSYTCRIWIAGDYADACRVVREFCEEGACFAVHPAAYIYTGGSESGVCVTRINYPRFPAEPDTILAQMRRLAEALRAALFQDSYSIETPTETVWFSRRFV